MRPIVPALLRYYGKLSLRWKILLSYIVLLVLMVAGLGTVAIYQINGLVQERLLQAYEANLNQLADNVGHRMRLIANSVEMAAWNNDLLRILDASVQQYPLDRQIDDIRILDGLVTTLLANDDITHARFYLPGDSIHSREGVHFFSSADAAKAPWSSVSSDRSALFFWFGPYPSLRDQEQVVSYIRRVGAAGDVFRNLGTIVVDVPVDTILKRMGDSAIKGGILEIRLLNEKGELVARTGMGDEGAVLPSAKGLRLNQALPYPAWEFSALISVQGLAQARRAILISFALTLLVVSAIAVAATLGFSKTIASRIDTLEDLATKVMVDPAVADLASFNEASFYDDEISHLQTYFVALLNRNRELLRQEHEKVLAEKDARLHALQMQIDPHFLYNTLDTINWAALENGQKEVSRLIGQLSTYYRLSLHNGQDVVALRNELEHVRAFLSLYEKRMAGLLWVEYDIDEAVFPYSTVKLILQPLAENAIIHGIRNTPSQSGTIRIQGRLLADRIEISVADDGIGFPMDRYRALMADPSQGFAVKNVDQRIKLFCGPEYGLRYDFGTPRGSCAVVSLSLRRG